MTDQEFRERCDQLSEFAFGKDYPVAPTVAVMVPIGLLREMLARLELDDGTDRTWMVAYRNQLESLARYAATCLQTNTIYWLGGLVKHLNQTCEVLCDSTRFEWRGGRIVKVEPPRE